MDTAPHCHTNHKSLSLAIMVTVISLSGAASAVLHVTGTAKATIVADTQEQRELSEWALGRYEAAGLELPPVIIEFADGDHLVGCEGALARTYLNQIPVLIKMCWNDQFTLLHELAHAWEAHNVPTEKHEPFMAMRTDATSWASREVPWPQRGREHAANVVAWGVLEDPYPVPRTSPTDPESMRDAFRFLTGTSPLHDGGPGIQEPDRQFFSAARTNPPLESGR